MINNLPFISIIISCRNEERFITRCLDSVINQDYPKDKLELLVIDGASEDRTREIIKDFVKKYSFVKLLNNPKKIKPIALNMSIKIAKGENIIIMDAHTIYKKDYILKSVKYLEEYKADNVGGVIKSIPEENTLSAQAIVFVLSHPFGVGNSYFRIGSKKPRWVDGLAFGCYRKEVFEKNGLFNENLIKSQDMEFNLRLKKAGGKILLVPEIIAYYYPKSNLKDFFLHNFKDGIWMTYHFKFSKIFFYPRHYIPLIFVSTLMGSIVAAVFSPPFILFFLSVIWLYLFLAFCFSIKTAFSKKEWKYLFLIPLAFACRHFGHGLGSLYGIVKIFLPS